VETTLLTESCLARLPICHVRDMGGDESDELEVVPVSNCAACHGTHSISLVVHYAPVMFQMIPSLGPAPGSSGAGTSGSTSTLPESPTVLHYRYICPEKNTVCNLSITVSTQPHSAATAGEVKSVT
jgi:hypothetical protein